MDGAGNIYFADSGNDIIRRIDAVSGIITTIAGVPMAQGYSGDGPRQPWRTSPRPEALRSTQPETSSLRIRATTSSAR
jgi:hypothetical protein